MKRIVLEAPGKNAISSELMRRVISELGDAKGEPVLLTGAGDVFSAGLNLKEVASLEGPAMKLFLRLLDDLVTALYEYPGPLVALVNGHAIAGGCVLALTADWRIAPEGGRARIGLNEVALGLRYPPRVLNLIRARVPPRWIEKVVLGAELFDAESAQRFGLIDEITNDSERIAEKRLAALAAHPRDAYTTAKLALRSKKLAPSADVLARFEREDLPSWVSPEQKARIASVLKR